MKKRFLITVAAVAATLSPMVAHAQTRELQRDRQEVREEKRELSRRIEELALYEGFLCAIELSFDYDGRVYVFDLETEWYEEWHEIMDEIEDAMPDDEEGSGGPYNLYSNN